MARFRDLYKSSEMHAASASLALLEGLAKNAPVAQLDRALDYESRGQEFESLRARHSTLDHAMMVAGYPAARSGSTMVAGGAGQAARSVL